ncbi:hypothetical protein EP47_12220 [Legionella norrlandica]|uniref:Uncharacterized protein n=1 Tax=Legionella norrlandica TaxID=1498499 RepID=A0A0A2T7Z6_9GAMM|nr:hypothetical protein EP47_12220 [Legionella norrlandica]
MPEEGFLHIAYMEWGNYDLKLPNIKLLSKLAAMREVRGETEHRIAVYTLVAPYRQSNSP